MNAFQRCPNTNDAIPFYLPQQLYLKPIARINVSIQLSQQKIMGKTITNWELMERLREMIKPDEFTVLKVTKTTVEVIRFEAEVEHKNVLQRVISKLDNKMIKLKDFPDLLRLRAALAKLNYPSRHEWDTYFRDAKNMDEMKAGERPDTVHISNLPSKWFIPYHCNEDKDNLPSEKILYRIFEKFGTIRNLDIPICDPYRHKMKSHITGIQTSSFDEKDFFEGYIQFKDYVGFSKCMDCLRGMKLLCKEDAENLTTNIYVDFDKMKHLSDASIRRREIVRDRMVLKEQSKDEKEREAEEKKLQIEKDLRDKELNKKSDKDKRRRNREEKRKAKILSQLKNNPTDDISDKIAKEEKKLIKVQRKLEAIRLVEELFQRIKAKNARDSSPKNRRQKGDEDELSTMKHYSELEVREQREKLHQAIGGRVVLKSILSGSTKKRTYSSSSEDSRPRTPNPEPAATSPILYPPMFDPNWYNYQGNNNVNSMYYHPSHFVNQNPPPMRGYFPFPPRGRGLRALPAPGPSRGMPFLNRNNYNPNFRGRGRGHQNHIMQQDFFKYAQKFLEEQLQSDHQYERARSRSRSYSPHRRSNSRSRSRRRSYSRSRRSYSRSRSRSRSRNRRSSSRNRSGSRSKRSASRWTPDANQNRRTSGSPRRSRSARRSRSKSASQNKPRSRSRSASRGRNNRETRSRTKSEKRDWNNASPKGRSRTKSRESLKSVDSSKFISPNRLRKSRSKS